MNWESKKFAFSCLGTTKSWILNSKFLTIFMDEAQKHLNLKKKIVLSVFMRNKISIFSKFMLISWKFSKLQTKIFSHDNFLRFTYTQNFIYKNFLPISLAELQKIYTQFFSHLLISSSFFTRIYQMKRLPDDVFAKRSTQLMFYIEIKRVGLTVQSNWLNLLRLWEFEALVIRKGVFPDWG